MFNASPSLPNPTLLDCLRDYLNNKPLKLRTKAQYENVIRRCVPDWLYRPMSTITRKDIQDRHKQLTAHGPYQANFCARVLRALFLFAENFYTDPTGEPIIKSNPMRVMAAMDLWNKETRRQRRIKPDEMPRYFAALLTMPNKNAADYLLFLTLTGMRKNEATQLTWQNVDLNKGLATVPDTKSKRPHVFPLPDVLWSLLQSRYMQRNCPPGSEPVFVSFNGVDPISRYDKSYEYICSVTGLSFSPHDLRRGFTSTAVEAGVHLYSIKRLLNHAIDCDGWTGAYFVSDVENLRVAVQSVCDAILSQAGIDKKDLAKRLNH